jgi:hypothetical protein
MILRRIYLPWRRITTRHFKEIVDVKDVEIVQVDKAETKLAKNKFSDDELQGQFQFLKLHLRN